MTEYIINSKNSEKSYTPSIHIHDLALSRFGTGTHIKSGGVKLSNHRSYKTNVDGVYLYDVVTVLNNMKINISILIFILQLRVQFKKTLLNVKRQFKCLVNVCTNRNKEANVIIQLR